MKNIVFGMVSQISILLVSFFGRTVFIKTLGAEYLGVSGLYNNILTVLSLAELGIGNVMIFSLYKPLASQDKTTILALLNYYKKIYRNIALTILGIGLLLVPFLNIIVQSSLSREELIFYYILFLLNSVSSYFVVYKTVLINADQKLYIVKTIQTLTIILKELLQILALIITNSFVLYLCIMIFCTLLNNILMNLKANKLYPFIKTNYRYALSESKDILNNIKSAFLYKIGVVVMNNTDNILISTIVGTVYVGYYSNYLLLITAVSTFLNVFVQALFSSLGNLNTDGNVQKSYKFFNTLLLLFHWLAASCSICFLLVFNDFIVLWIGQDYVMNKSVVMAIVINFYIQNIITPVWMYRETMGLFKQIKFIMLIASSINICLSVVGGLYWGITGIILATTFSRVLTTVWYEPKLLFNTKFHISVRNYWSKQFKYFSITCVTTIILFLVTYNIGLSLMNIIIKIIVGFVVMSFSFILISYKSEEFSELKNYLKKFKKVH